MRYTYTATNIDVFLLDYVVKKKHIRTYCKTSNTMLGKITCQLKYVHRNATISTIDSCKSNTIVASCNLSTLLLKRRSVSMQVRHHLCCTIEFRVFYRNIIYAIRIRGDSIGNVHILCSKLIIDTIIRNDGNNENK